MTTYILHGGKTSIDNKKNDEFFHQFTALVNKPIIKIMVCYWAREKTQWEELRKRDSAKILKNSNKIVEIDVIENPTDMFSKLAEYDVLYVAGGEAELLEPFYSELNGLKEQLDGKVYAGSSMGAFLASSRYVLSLDDQDTETVHKGLGLVPFQILCHWNIETKKEQKVNLLNNNSDLPIIVLNESEFITIY